MKDSNKISSKKVLKSIWGKIKKSKMAFKIGLVANLLAVLAFIFCLLSIFSLYAVIAFGMCLLIEFFAYGVLLIDTLSHRAK
ncbi:MAG: hypothetical protein K0S47_2464 [Herbinix sp.]|jgi:hypothetical protein|nr:hypothetical protein [Herbinix sp.]